MHFLGKNLRYLRKRSSQNQDAIAILFNKGQTTIGNWENGVSEPGIDDLLTISNYFGISVDALLRTDLTREGRSPGEEEKSKTPLARELSAPEAIKYDLDGEISMVQENYGDRLSPILEEIRMIRSEIERIKTHLPGSG